MYLASPGPSDGAEVKEKGQDRIPQDDHMRAKILERTESETSESQPAMLHNDIMLPERCATPSSDEAIKDVTSNITIPDFVQRILELCDRLVSVRENESQEIQEELIEDLNLANWPLAQCMDKIEEALNSARDDQE